jgi:hypothetical protein
MGRRAPATAPLQTVGEQDQGWWKDGSGVGMGGEVAKRSLSLPLIPFI